MILRLRRDLGQHNLVVRDRLLPLERRAGDDAERLAKRDDRLARLPCVSRERVGDVRAGLVVEQLHLQAVGRWQAKRGRDTAVDRRHRAAERRRGRNGRSQVALKRHAKVFNRNLPLAVVVQHSPLSGLEGHRRIAPGAALEHVHHQFAGRLVELGQAAAVRQGGEQVGHRVAVLAVERVGDKRLAFEIRHLHEADGVFRVFLRLEQRAYKELVEPFRTVDRLAVLAGGVEHLVRFAALGQQLPVPQVTRVLERIGRPAMSAHLKAKLRLGEADVEKFRLVKDQPLERCPLGGGLADVGSDVDRVGARGARRHLAQVDRGGDGAVDRLAVETPLVSKRPGALRLDPQHDVGVDADNRLNRRRRGRHGDVCAVDDFFAFRLADRRQARVQDGGFAAGVTHRIADHHLVTSHVFG